MGETGGENTTLKERKASGKEHGATRGRSDSLNATDDKFVHRTGAESSKKPIAKSGETGQGIETSNLRKNPKVKK